MPVLAFTGNLPSSEELRQTVAEAIAATNPIDDLLVLAERLNQYEQENRMSSATFRFRYDAGTLHEELQHCIEWAATYDLFLKTKRTLEATLMRVAIQPELSEALA